MIKYHYQDKGNHYFLSGFYRCVERMIKSFKH